MAVKILCALITVTLMFGEIRANVEPRSSSSEKYVPMSSVFPSSLLFLLNRSPLRHRSLPSKPAAPSNPASHSVPSSSAAPFIPDVPNSPDAPLPRTTPSLPNSPVSPSLPPSPKRQPPRYPLPYYPHRATPQYFSSPVNSVPTPGMLSYDYTSGNRKLLNKVHIPLRGNPTQPQPVGALPLNYDSSDNVPTFQQKPLPSNPNMVPLGALPLNDQSNTGNTNKIKPEDLTPGPIDTIGASPIPIKPNKSSDSDDSKNIITFNTKDLSYQPVSNIEASPIPLRPEVNGSENNEDLSPLPSDAAVGPSIPNQPENNNEGDSSDNENTLTINPGDLTPEPADTIAASPIPVKSKTNQPPFLEASDITEPKALPIRPEVNGSENNEDSTSLKSKNNNDGDASDDESTITIDPQNLASEPTDTIAASPIPVKSKNNQPPTLEASDTIEPQARNDESHKITQEGNDESSNDQSKSPEDNEEPQNPLKDLVLNGTSSSDNDEKFNPLGNVILNGTSSQGCENAVSSDEPENSLKDRIVNESSSQNEETESESSGVENSGPNQESTEIVSREASQEYSDNGDGIQSSKTEEHESEVLT